MLLYHITNKEYSLGKVSTGDFVGESSYHQGLGIKKKEINIFLSEHRPDCEPSRQRCIYLFDNPLYCVYFKKAEYDQGEQLHLYECEVAGKILGHPMILVNQFAKNQKNKWVCLSEEYWAPTMCWAVKEYLAEEVKIVREIQIQGLMQAPAGMIGVSRVSVLYSQDLDKANSFVANISDPDDCSVL